MERIKGIDGNGNYIYEHVDDEIQKVINENFSDMLGKDDNDDRLISLNKACEWLKINTKRYWMCYAEDFINEFKKAMEE